MLVVSRGIVEASRKGEEFGVERVKQSYQRVNAGNPRELSAGILSSVEQFMGAPPMNTMPARLEAADGGPVATPENLQFVQTPFLVEAVREAIPHLREDAAAVAQSWLDRQGGSNV